jgi:hypothetical protein
VKGVVQFVDLEGGYYAVDGWRLVGDQAFIKRFAGLTVFAEGTEFTGVSIFMNQALVLSAMTPIDKDGNRGEKVMLTPVSTRPIKAEQAVPAQITVDGIAAKFDQAPTGTLMVPLRAVVEAAGGTVKWNGELRTVEVRIKDRNAAFVIGQNEAEMNQDGHNYLVRNMLKMAKASVIQNGRTLVSADALSTVLGLSKSGVNFEGYLVLVK